MRLIGVLAQGFACLGWALQGPSCNNFFQRENVPVSTPEIISQCPDTLFTGWMKSVEVYGFVGWILTLVAYVAFIIWAYAPQHILEDRLGITYYPDKSWALTIPALLCTVYALSGVAYVGINMLSTAPLDSMQTLTDSWAKKPVMYPSNSSDEAQDDAPRRRQVGLSVPNFADLDIGVVNHLLYASPPPSSSSSSSNAGQQPKHSR